MRSGGSDTVSDCGVGASMLVRDCERVVGGVCAGGREGAGGCAVGMGGVEELG